jgi:hypothetical protein
MSDLDRLHHDLVILQEMAEEMDQYLRSDVLFWNMGKSNMPQLTLGGYLLRQHRVTAVRAHLDEIQRQQLDQAVATFAEVLKEKVVITEKKATEELGARMRQWGAYIRDLRESHKAVVNYETAVENRTIIEALLSFLQESPYQFDHTMMANVHALDAGLRPHFHSNGFVWDDVWQSAYDPQQYWWLFGQPK